MGYNRGNASLEIVKNAFISLYYLNRLCVTCNFHKSQKLHETSSYL
jgi:hypothetical protein